jgi:hypothetical protein
MAQPTFEPQDAAYAQRVRDSFALQGAMGTIGASLGAIAPGTVEILLDWAPGLTQQHGFLHAGMVATALDSACGYAGLHPDAGRRRCADHRIQDQPAGASAKASAFAWWARWSSPAAPSP